MFARTETETFFAQVWEKAHSILFIRGRLYFHHADGSKADANAGAPSCLVAYGESDSLRLRMCPIKGQYVRLR